MRDRALSQGAWLVAASRRPINSAQLCPSLASNSALHSLRYISLHISAISGFCKIATTHGFFQQPHFADVSAFIDGSLYLEVKSSTPSYTGFKVGFTAKNVTRPRPGMHHAGPSFKSDFMVPASAVESSDGFTVVKIPFSHFSVDWSE